TGPPLRPPPTFTLFPYTTLFRSATLVDGTYTAQTSQSDSAGNTGTSLARTFRVDTAAPVVTLDQPTTPTSDNTPALTGTGGTATGDDTTVTIRIYRSEERRVGKERTPRSGREHQ